MDLAGAKGRLRNKGPQNVEHLTGNGIIRVRRRVYWQRGSGSDQRLDRWLGIADSSVSVAARELCCQVSVAQVSFTKSAELLDRVGNIQVSKERMRQIVEEEGRRVNALRQAGQVRPDWQAKDCAVAPGRATRVMTGSDGVMVPVITEAEKQKRRAKWTAKRAGKKSRKRKAKRAGRRVRGADQSYKEFKIGVFYDQSRQHQYAFGTPGDHQALGRQLRREAAKLRLDEADEKLSVSDGAEWIRRQMQGRLPMLDAMILDFYHLAEHVAGAANICFGEGSEDAAQWTKMMLDAARDEGAGGLLLGIAELNRTTRSPSKKKALKGLQDYVAKRAEMVDYPTFKAKGFDIGSGPTEAFCKTLTARLKGSGMRWDRPNAEAMMALAALEHSHLWNGYWQAQRQAAA
jgi:hypothetical protein